MPQNYLHARMDRRNGYYILLPLWMEGLLKDKNPYQKLHSMYYDQRDYDLPWNLTSLAKILLKP